MSHRTLFTVPFLFQRISFIVEHHNQKPFFDVTAVSYLFEKTNALQWTRMLRMAVKPRLRPRIFKIRSAQSKCPGQLWYEVIIK